MGRIFSGTWFRLPGFTVMRRELAQIAAQRNTYILRALYALTVAVVGLIYFYSTVERYSGAALRRLGYGYGYGFGYGFGIGKRMLTSIIAATLASVVVVLPAMVVGSVTSEREQGTLDLMRISRLSPWDIVLQKYFARLVPFCTFLLLLVPLCAVAYSLGGISVADLATAVATLLSAVMRVAAVSLLCSALCGTTMAAFLSAYLFLFLIYAAFPFLTAILFHNLFRYYNDDWIESWIFGPWLDSSPSFGEQVKYVILLLIGLWVCLACTRLLLGRSRRLRGALAKRCHRWLDLWLERLNRFVGNVRWGGKGDSLPDAAPVAWRERSRAAVCVPRHMFRLLCLVCVPTIFILSMIWIPHSLYNHYRHGGGEGFAVFLMFLWLPALLVPAVYVANLISGERSDQTLDVLLTTPIAPRNVLRQKLAAVPRLVMLMALPMLMTVFTKFYCVYGHSTRNTDKAWIYLFLSLGSIAVYEWLVVWIAFHSSLRTRRRSVVVLLTLVRLIGFIFIPLLTAFLVNALNHNHFEELFYLSPVGLFIFTEFDMDMQYFGWVVTGLCAYFLAAFLIRWHCLKNAERLLCRPPKV